MEEKISLKLFSDVGMGEIFVSRLFHFSDHILNGVSGLDNHAKIKESIFCLIFEGLEPAYQSLRELRKDYTNKKVPEKKKRLNFENIYSYLTIAYKDKLQQTARLFGYDLGFIFQKPNNFEIGCQKFIESYPRIGADFVEIIKGDKTTWLDLTISIRNNVVNHTLGVDPNLIKELEENMTLEIVEKIFDNCWRSIEDVLLLLAIDKHAGRYGMDILEIKEYQQNKDHLERFGWFDTTLINK